ncbi:hypothetical protein M2R47_01960 [Moraxella sp. Tifton1]|uniref:hypothetical protein n=1 Tax=Moraxella oculi TaxID=2940516 RepID=UPI002011C2D6|nr:hypothetical protein [Moraxella sp. Tifton1]MCL1623020.1 hypothetical protein [Moraxella sp. Tifton1]
MATFSPTPQFSRRWLATPSVVKQAFHQEMDDIIHMLGSDIPAANYQFTNQDFGSAIAELLTTYSNTQNPAKLVHSFDSTPLIADKAENFNQKEFAEIESRIIAKLSAQLDDFLTEHLSQLSIDLKAWVDTAVKNELNSHQTSNTPHHQSTLVNAE